MRASALAKQAMTFEPQRAWLGAQAGAHGAHAPSVDTMALAPRPAPRDASYCSEGADEDGQFRQVLQNMSDEAGGGARRASAVAIHDGRTTASWLRTKPHLRGRACPAASQAGAEDSSPSPAGEATMPAAICSSLPAPTGTDTAEAELLFDRRALVCQQQSHVKGQSTRASAREEERSMKERPDEVRSRCGIYSDIALMCRAGARCWPYKVAALQASSLPSVIHNLSEPL
jgi:hypothetical protein